MRLGEIFPADDQAGDWYGWLTNQGAHAMVGVGIGLAFTGLGMVPLIAVICAAGVYWAVWERSIQSGKDWRDSLQDTAHVTTGAALIVLALQGHLLGACIAYAAWCVNLAVGVWRRA